MLGVLKRYRLGRMSINAQRELAEGSAEKSVELCRRLVAEWWAIQGSDGERVLTWRGFLGRALTEARRYSEAESALSDLLLDRERVFGADDESVFVTRGNLSRAIALGGRPVEALVVARRLLDDRLRVLGPEHHATLDTRGHIAHFHYLAGQFDIAAQLYGELLEDRIRILGADHPDVFTSRFNLATSRTFGGHPLGINELREIAEELQDGLGPQHVITLNALGLLADGLIREGETEEGLSIARRVLDIRSRTLGDSDAKTIFSRTLIARTLLKSGQRDETLAEMRAICASHAKAGRLQEIDGLSAMCDLLKAAFALFEDKDPDDSDGDFLVAIVDLVEWFSESCARLEPDHPLREWAAQFDDLISSIRDGYDEESTGETTDDSEFDDSISSALYSFTYETIPNLIFGERGSTLLRALVGDHAESITRFMWDYLCGDVRLDSNAFQCKRRTRSDGSVQTIIRMPVISSWRLEAQFIGVHVPMRIVERLEATVDFPIAADRDGVRLIYLEQSLLPITSVREHCGADQHIAHGIGPKPTFKGMWRVMDQVCGR